MNLFSTSHPFNHTQFNLQNFYFHTPQLPSNNLRVIPHIHTTIVHSLTNAHNLPPHTLRNNPQTLSSSTVLFFTVSDPTYTTSSASISEPTKQPKLQPVTDHEYKFWHARHIIFF